jgi:hypothetical protein
MNYDVFFISFNESNQEKNWQRVQELHPTAIRLHGIKGIDRVHLLCNNLSSTEWFWTVDGDNWLLGNLTHQELDKTEIDLFMYHALDPLTKKWTKLGGVKLWRKDSFINTDMSKGDFCLNAVKEKRSPLKVLSRTDYNASPYEAWKTSFRHCVKLMSTIIDDRPLAANKQQYLNDWKTCKDLDDGSNNATWAYNGYLDAKLFIENNEDLFKINDYEWLKSFFKNKYYD